MNSTASLDLIYTRISENRTDETEKTDYQEQRGRAFSAELGGKVHAVYCDDNVSGSKRLQRKQWNRLWEDAEELARSGHRVRVIARDTDRLTRNKREAIDVMDRVEETGVRIVTYTRDFDTDRPEWEDDLMYRVMGGERYSRAISKNQKMKQEQLLKDGAWRGGIRPFGYYPQVGTKLRNNVERPAYDQTAVRPEEAALIKSGTETILRGGSLAQVVRDWNAAGIPTTAGKPWTIQGVKVVLNRWRNAGLVEHKGTIVNENAAWPAIVSREDVAAVREILSSKTVRVPANGRGAPERVQARNTRPKNNARVHLLSGILTCAAPSKTDPAKTCGGAMNQKKIGPNVAYSCKACHRNIKYAVANERVTSYAVARLAAGDPAISRMGGDNITRLTTLAHELAALAEKKAKLQAADEAGAIDYDVFLAQQAKITEQRERITAEQGKIRRSNAIAALIEGVRTTTALAPTQDREVARTKIRERFDALSVAERATVILALGIYEVLPNPSGVRPTDESARHRIKITPLDPGTGEPYIYESEQAEAV